MDNNSRLEYEKQMSKLMTITNSNCEGNKDVKELVEWYRKVSSERIIKGGDHVVITEIIRAVSTGLTLSMALHEAYVTLKYGGRLDYIKLEL